MNVKKGFHEFEERVEKNLEYVENKYGISKDRMKKKFFDNFSKLGFKEKENLKDKIANAGLYSATALGLISIATANPLIGFAGAELAVASTMLDVTDINTKKKLKKVV